MINQLINANLIQLDLQANSKQEVFEELINILHAQGRISDKATFLNDIQAREELGNTGFEDGVAIPHAKSAAVTQPAVAIGVSKKGIDYGAEDGLPSKLFFMIASPDGGDDHHIEVLAELSSKLIEEGFIDAFLNAETSEQAIEILIKKSERVTTTAEKSKGLIIGVTGCPAGIAHTYLAAEALEKGAAALGYQIKVETNGSIGVKNSPNAEEIEQAEAIVVACDKQVDLTRFAGKRLIKTNVKAPIRDAQKLINEALNAPSYQVDNTSNPSVANKASQARSDLYRFLMNGVSHMIPFVVTGGLLIALALAVGGEPTEAGMAIPPGSMWNQILEVGVVAFTLMIPILAGYIAYAIADRPALAPGLIGGWIANNGSFYGAEAGTGFIGAIVAGLLVGYFVKWITSINYHKFIQPLVPIMIAPITGSLFIAGLFIFVIGAPIASLMDGLTALLTSMSTGNVILLGIVLGAWLALIWAGHLTKSRSSSLSA